MGIKQHIGHIKTNVPGTLVIFARGTGAGAANLTSVKGVTSIAETATGEYTVTLEHKVKGLLNVSGQVIDVTSPDDWAVSLKSDLTSGNSFGILVTKSGTAADLTTDEKLLLTIWVENSAVLPASY